MNKSKEEIILEKRIKKWKKDRLDYICKIAIPFFIIGIITSSLTFYFLSTLYGIDDIEISMGIWIGAFLFIPFLYMTYPKKPTIIDVHLDLSLYTPKRK